MKIIFCRELSCGNAVRLVLTPDASVERWRLLRKETDDFAGAMDPQAFVVMDGATKYLTDCRMLTNGVTYFYRAYGLLADGSWSESEVRSAVPVATFDDMSVNAQEIVRERLEVTLHSMIARGQVVLSQPTLPVLSIPFYQQGTEFPVVTVLYGNGGSSVRAIGEQMACEEHDGYDWTGAQGWHESTSLEIHVRSLNASERNILRMALQAAIAANLHIFDELGLSMVEVQSVSDTEDQSMNAPVFQTLIRLGCQVVVAVTDEYGSFVEIDVKSFSF